MDVRSVYNWEIETVDGTVLTQYDENGKEQSWKNVDAEKIVRFSYVPTVPLLPRHDTVFDLPNGERFVRRFGRGFLKQKDNFEVKEYLYVVISNHYRLYVFGSSGRTLLTKPDLEVYL
jgi:hypothetical protein